MKRSFNDNDRSPLRNLHRNRAEIFIDTSGMRHLTTIPRGKMQPSVWAKNRDRGTATLTKPLQNFPKGQPIRVFPLSEIVPHQKQFSMMES
jgi:hypothetical protein